MSDRSEVRPGAEEPGAHGRDGRSPPRREPGGKGDAASPRQGPDGPGAGTPGPPVTASGAAGAGGPLPVDRPGPRVGPRVVDALDPDHDRRRRAPAGRGCDRAGDRPGEPGSADRCRVGAPGPRGRCDGRQRLGGLAGAPRLDPRQGGARRDGPRAVDPVDDRREASVRAERTRRDRDRSCGLEGLVGVPLANAGLDTAPEIPVPSPTTRARLASVRMRVRFMVPPSPCPPDLG